MFLHNNITIIRMSRNRLLPQGIQTAVTAGSPLVFDRLQTFCAFWQAEAVASPLTFQLHLKEGKLFAGYACRIPYHLSENPPYDLPLAFLSVCQ